MKLERVGKARKRLDVVRTPPRVGKRAVGIVGLLHWAFQRELVRLDFDEEVQAPSFGMEYVMLEQARLGCRVDGGGRSDAHPDADLVASALAVLPEHVGGRRMAIWIAELARAGRVPDCMTGERPKFVPVDTRTNRFGCFAKTADSADLGNEGWPAQPRRNRKGVIVKDKVLYCPVRISPSPAQIGQARRGYLAWWGALLDLSNTFQIKDNLDGFVVTNEMPPLEPWKRA